MPLVKFKICPDCEKHNPPSRLQCQKCEMDLSSVKIVDETSLQNNTNTALPNEPTKQCDCGTTNLSQARKCSSCGEDISDIRPVISQPVNAEKRFFLHSINDNYSFTLEKTVTIIGREAEMKDYLSVKSYVSRQHAKFTIANDDIYVSNMSATNRTFVNNFPIPSNVPTLLKNGDEIGIGGKLVNGNRQSEAAYFTFEAIL